MSGEPPGNGLPKVTPPEPVLLDIQAAIQRKGQVILHGPPETGKTYTGLPTLHSALTEAFRRLLTEAFMRLFRVP